MIYLDNAATTRPCPACVAAPNNESINPMRFLLRHQKNTGHPSGGLKRTVFHANGAMALV